MSLLDLSPSKKQWLKFFSIFTHWLGFYLILHALTKPIMVINSNQAPIYLIWDLNGFSFDFYNLSPLAPRYFLIIILSLLTSLRSESFDISSKLLTIILLIIIFDTYIYLSDYTKSVGNSTTSDGFVFVSIATILIIIGLLLSLYYNYVNWKDKSIEVKITDKLYPQTN